MNAQQRRKYLRQHAPLALAKLAAAKLEGRLQNESGLPSIIDALRNRTKLTYSHTKVHYARGIMRYYA
jgi:hypothetical protein